jgi:hypothetical protein
MRQKEQRKNEENLAVTKWDFLRTQLNTEKQICQSGDSFDP